MEWEWWAVDRGCEGRACYVVVWWMIPDGWLDGGRCGEGQCSCSGKGRIIMGAFRYQAMMRCGYGAVHMVMRHGWASMMYRSWQVCVSSMMGGCSLDAGVRSREPRAREMLSAFSVVSGVLEMEQVGKSRREFGRGRREFWEIDQMGRWIWLQFGMLRFLLRALPPAARMSPKVTACQQRAWAGRNGDVRYLWIPFLAAIGVHYRSSGYGSGIYYASILSLLCTAGRKSEVCDGFISRHRRNHRESSPSLCSFLDLHDTSILADGDQ